jgi:membrane protease YdiL (CAAX protease family)
LGLPGIFIFAVESLEEAEALTIFDPAIQAGFSIQRDLMNDQLELEVMLVLTNVTVGFMMYHFISRSDKVHQTIESYCGIEKAKVAQWHFRRICGFLFLGAIPLILTFSCFEVDFQKYGFWPLSINKQSIWAFIISATVVLMNYFNAQKTTHLSQYPQMRIDKWTGKLLVANSITWIIYLIGYESLFRGLLLFTFKEWLGASIAVSVNVCIYALVHIPKGVKEAIGAIPLGILLCWITLKTGNIWSAVMIHIVLALSNDYFSLYFNPSMSLKIK